jgi:hypothetical protein
VPNRSSQPLRRILKRYRIDASGRLTGPPLRPVQVLDRVVIAVVLIPVGLGIVLLATGMLADHLLERRRLAAWVADWQATGPRWTSAG